MTHSRRPVPLIATDALRERLKSRGVRTPSGCLEWDGSRDIHGYGWIHFDGKTVKVHRAAFAAFVRPVEAGETICHRCDNPPCFAPEHLFAGTMLDNTRDMIAKGRRRIDPGFSVGEKHPMAKLTEADVRDIRARRAAGAKYAELMADFNLSKTTIGEICTRKTWRHLT